MTSRQLCDLRNNPRVYGHTQERFGEMASCIKVSEKHNALCDASHMCGRALAAALQNRNMAGTAEAERARSAASGAAPEKRRYVVSGETVRRIPDGSDVDDTNLTFTFSTKSIPEDLDSGRAGSGHADGHSPRTSITIRYDRDPDEHLVRGVTGSKKPVLKETYIAAQCIVAGHRFVLACLPFGRFDENVAKVRELPEICTGYGIRPGTVMLDREFHSTGVMSAPDRAGVTCLIPCVSHGYAPGAIPEYLAGKRLRVSDAAITKDRCTSCRYTLVITDRKKLRMKKKEEKDRAPEEKLIAFATGDPDMDVDAYAKRRGIKTGFRQVRSIRIKTRSKNHAARHLVFTLSVVLYNCWVFGCAMLARMNSRTVHARPVMVLYALVGALLDLYEGAPAKPPPLDPDWPLP